MNIPVLDVERWLPIAGFEGLYEVSDHGRVRSLPSVRGGGRVLKGCTAHSGHLLVRLRKDGQRHPIFVHRLVLTTFVGPCPTDLETCHNDGNPQNNRLDNLRWDTRASNSRDTIAHGRNVNAAKTECPSGHRYTAANTKLKNGRRHCRQCIRTQAAAYQRQRRATLAGAST